MAHFDVATVFPPGSPSVPERRDLFKKTRGLLGSSSLPVDNLTQNLQPRPPRGSQDLDGNNGVSTASPNSTLGAIQKATNSQSSSESIIPSGPLDTGIYKRFNEKEQKEREKVAENWIPAVIKK